MRRATITKVGNLRHAVNFYPRSPCGERQERNELIAKKEIISIHALLAESDLSVMYHNTRLLSFLSTLSLRRATAGSYKILPRPVFLSTLSLRRATLPRPEKSGRGRFLSTLSLRRATALSRLPVAAQPQFLSTLSLRRATLGCKIAKNGITISIHALLAESDLAQGVRNRLHDHFYPRSPCGERLRLFRAWL